MAGRGERGKDAVRMGDEIHSPGFVTFSFRPIICDQTRHHSIGYVYARGTSGKKNKRESQCT